MIIPRDKEYAHLVHDEPVEGVGWLSPTCEFVTISHLDGWMHNTLARYLLEDCHGMSEPMKYGGWAAHHLIEKGWYRVDWEMTVGQKPIRDVKILNFLKILSENWGVQPNYQLHNSENCHYCNDIEWEKFKNE